MTKQTSTQPNAFLSVRPVANPGPSAAPIQASKGKPPLMMAGSLTRSVDNMGRLRNPEQSKSMRGFFIENAQQSQVSRDKTQAIVKGGR